MWCNICYWGFFLSQGNRWTKYLVHSKIQRPKASLLMFDTLDGFHLLLSAQLTADLTLKWSGGSMFHPLSYIYAKTLFCCIETVATVWITDALLFLINCEQTQHPFWTQLSHWQIFMQNVEYTSTPLLSHATSIYNQPKWVCRVFWYFLRQLPNLGNLSIQHNLCLYDCI